jgi:hypothetical protein
MSWDRGTSRQPAAAGDENGGESGEDGAVARRLRVLGAVCASLLVAVLAAAAAIGWSAARPGGGDLMESPPVDSFLVALGAMLLVLLASAVYGRILRRQAAAEVEEAAELEEAAEAEGVAAAEDAVEAEEAAARERLPAARLRAYSWATGASFGMLTVAAALGAMVASAGKAPLYGLVICIGALFSMAARWPRRSGFDLALRSDREDAVSRAAAWRNLAQPFANHDARASHAAGASGSSETALGAGGREAAGEGASGGATEATAGAEPGDAARGEMGRRPR